MKRELAPVAREVIRSLLDYAKIDTIRGVYERLAPSERDGRIRSWMNPVGAETLRFTHSESFLEASTNLGNLPKKVAKLDPLYDARAILVPERGRVLLEADLSQAEARIAAWEAGDPLAIAQYAEGIDRYRFFAAHLYYGTADAMADVTKVVRDTVGKEGILSLQYGVEWRTFMLAVNANADLTGVTISAATAKKAVALFHRLYPGYVRWWDRVAQEVATRGYVTNCFGYRRDFFGRTDTERDLAAIKREAVAAIPQSTIACLLNERLAYVYERYDPQLMRVLLQVHDAIIVDARMVDAKRASLALKEALEIEIEIGGLPLIVPAEVSMSSTGWTQMKKAA